MRQMAARMRTNNSWRPENDLHFSKQKEAECLLGLRNPAVMVAFDVSRLQPSSATSSALALVKTRAGYGMRVEASQKAGNHGHAVGLPSPFFSISG